MSHIQGDDEDDPSQLEKQKNSFFFLFYMINYSSNEIKVKASCCAFFRNFWMRQETGHLL